MNPAPAIDIQGLSFAWHDSTPALTDISLRVGSGERVGIVGANGAGKTTLLLHLNGILGLERGAHDHGASHAHAHTHGSLSVCGLPVEKRHLQEIRRRVGLLFQDPDDQLFCPTVGDDVAFGPRNLGLETGEVARRVEQALAAVGLAGFARRSPHHLSLGEKKRAALAGVLAMNASVLALDEPTAGLDPRGRREFAKLLAGLDATLLVISHDLDFVRGLCGRAVVLSKGRIVADGPPADVLANAAFLIEHGLA